MYKNNNIGNSSDVSFTNFSGGELWVQADHGRSTPKLPHAVSVHGKDVVQGERMYGHRHNTLVDHLPGMLYPMTSDRVQRKKLYPHSKSRESKWDRAFSTKNSGLTIKLRGGRRYTNLQLVTSIWIRRWATRPARKLLLMGARPRRGPHRHGA